MTRGLSANNLSAIAQPHIRPIVFVRLAFDGGEERIHNAVGEFRWPTAAPEVWTGIGALGEIGPLEEGLDLSPFGVTLQLNALNSDLMSIATGEPLFNRRVTIYIGYLDENGVLVADPQERWSGMMDHVSIKLGAENIIQLQCENHLRFFDRANGSLFTDEDQQRRFSGDKFFEFLPQMIDVKLTWEPGAFNTGLLRPSTRTPGSAPGTQPRGPHPALDD